ncbi:MAG: hypothetical protein NTZ39_07130 [Methanoregula sp.]|nr:hypothetical protein [Methanoregula sp.]
MTVCACIVITAVFLSGCLGQKTQTTPEPQPPAVFVDYQRTGGLTGQDAHLVIFDNGAGVISTRSTSTEFALNKSDLARMMVLFNAAQYSMLQTNYPAPHAGADVVNYSISYHSKTVTMQDPAIPPAIQPVLDEMNRIVTSVETQTTNRPFVNVKI